MAFSKLNNVHLTENQFSIFSARVLSGKGKKFRVLTVIGQFQDAELAASCLVAPMVNSDVLLAQGHTQSFILAVLTHPAQTLSLEAEAIELQSESLKIVNKKTEVKTKQWRFDVRRFFSFAKRAYLEIGELCQKTDTTYLESQHYKLKTEYLAEETQGLRASEAEVIVDKAEVSSIQADKFLIG